MKHTFAVLMLVALTACAHTGSERRLRVEVTPPTAAAFQADLQAARSDVQSLSAEARITYLGKQGRFRGTASLALRRPDALRADIFGPHGGVLFALAANGTRLAALDMQHNRFLCGDASASAFDNLLGEPMQLSGAEWVGLLVGDMRVPPQAQLSSDGQTVVARWQRAEWTYELTTDGTSHRLLRLQVRVTHDGRSLFTADVGKHDGRGLPTALSIEWQSGQSGERLDIRLRDVIHNPTLADATFTLVSPNGIRTEPL